MQDLTSSALGLDFELKTPFGHDCVGSFIVSRCLIYNILLDLLIYFYLSAKNVIDRVVK